LIDFEQLKIENQSVNEKIEERNEELIKLRKKTTVTVQVCNSSTGPLARRH
jgi:histone deacetylase 6